eukprot:364868-Chlamydomonas_euryale.AAC.8
MHEGIRQGELNPISCGWGMRRSCPLAGPRLAFGTTDGTFPAAPAFSFAGCAGRNQCTCKWPANGWSAAKKT